MTEQNMIPAEKVRELIEHFESKDIGIESYGILGRFRALLPAPPQPTTGLLGRWAKHPEHGDVVCVAERPASGLVKIAFQDNCVLMSVKYATVALSSLTFPEQATRPEDVPENQPWLVDVNEGEQSLQSVVAIKGLNKMWLTLEGATEVTWCSNGIITLVCPLTPERPGESDLQARYDALEQKYTELERKHFELGVELSIEQQANGSSNDWGDEQPPIPCTVTTKEEYAALPIGSRVSVGSELQIWEKTSGNGWKINEQAGNLRSNAFLDGITRTVLRYGWGDEQPDQPAWRIEHDWRNLRGDEYIIDKNGDPVVTETKHWAGEPRYTDSLASVVPEYARFIVFPSKEAATPEAIEEAMKERDKERGK